MSVLTATNGNVQTAAGDLVDVPAAAFTVAAVFYRAGTTTDGFEAMLALATAGGQVITNIGADAGASPYEVSFAQGGATRTFGFDDLVDDDAYLFVVRKTAGTVAPRANLYRFDAGSPGWDGWVDGSDTVENRSDVIAAGWLMNQPGGFPWNGGLYVAAWWDEALSEAAVTNGSTGLHIGAQQWLDLDPVALWRPGETDPVEDESAAGTSDETSSSSVTIVAGSPTGFAMDFGGATVTGSAAANLGALTATATGKRTVYGSAAANLGALTATATGKRTAYGSAAANLGALTATATGTRGVRGSAVADLGALTATAAGKRTVYGAAVADLGALTATASDGLLVPGSGPRVVSARTPGRATASRTPGRLTASRPGGRL